MGINVLIMVEDASKTLDFYQRLGFEQQMFLKHQGRLYYGEVSFQGRDNQYLLMFLEREWWRFPDEKQVRSPGVGTVLYIPVQDLDKVYKQIREHARVISPPQNLYYAREFVIEDEDGYKLAFIEEYPEGEQLLEDMEIWRPK